VRQTIDELQWQEYAARTHTDLPVTRIDETAPQLRPPVGRVVLSYKGVQIDHALLVPGRFIVGRTSDNDMQVESKFVSRHHMQFVTSVDSCYVEDLNSTNGVFLNGKRVRRHKLQPGDVIKLGVHDLTYTRVDLPSLEDPRATRTTVLQPSDYDDEEAETEEFDDEEADERDGDERNGDERDGDERDGPAYSSMARGS
jgi:hypothetical protein